MQALRPRLLAWTAKLSELHRDANTFSSEARRAILDVLHGEFVLMFWDAARPQTARASRHQPQPDWWDDECYNMMARRNAAWRSWFPEGTAQARDAFRSMRRAFHHLVAKRKPCIGIVGFKRKNVLQLHALSLQRVIFARQFGPSRRPLPANMRSSSPHGGTVEGAACIDAWRCHFRNVPVSAGSVSASSPDLESDVRRLRRQMYARFPL